MRKVVPPATRAMVVIAFLFLAVCCLNLVGLLLAKFLSRAGRLGVHRALGASRRDVFVQRLVECELVGAGGGLLGLGLAALAMGTLDRMLPSFLAAHGLLTANAFTLVVALGLALVAGLLSGIYPAWRACRIAPAVQLKLQ